MVNDTELFAQCNNISVADVRRLALVRGAVSVFCFVLCLATFVFELIFICRQRRKLREAGNSKSKSTTTLQRLFVYLIFSNMLYTATLSLHMEHYFPHRSDGFYCIACKVIGFIDQYAGSVQLLLTTGIIMKLFHKLCSFRAHKITKGLLSIYHYKLEALFVAACFLLPLLLIWVPFIQNGAGEYGLNGAWCWLQAMHDNCTDSRNELWEELVLWYIPFAVVSVLSLVCIAIITSCLIYIHSLGKTYRKKIRIAILDMMLMLPFLIMFCFTCFVEIFVTLFNKFGSSLHLNKYVMWMLYAIMTPVSGVVIPIALFIYHLRRKNIAVSFRKLHDVSNIWPHTVPPSTRKTVDSDSDVDRPSFLSKSGRNYGTMD